MENGILAKTANGNKRFKKVASFRTKNQRQFIGVAEPNRKTMYDVLVENLRLANRKTFIHRLVYCGEHDFEIESAENDEIVSIFKNIVNQANDNYFAIEKLTGFLLFYVNHFIHIVEGDEDVISRHVNILYYQENISHFRKLKLLGHITHINRRLTNDWIHHFGTPRKCVNPDLQASVKHIGINIFVVITKLYRLIELVRDQSESFLLQSRSHADQSFALDFGSNRSTRLLQSKIYSQPVLTPSVLSLELCSASAVGVSKRFNIKDTLPEVEVLQFLLNADYPVDLKNYQGSYGATYQRDIYKDRVWPIPADYVPYDVFEKLYDPTTDFPTDSFQSQFRLLKRSQMQQELEMDEKQKQDQQSLNDNGQKVK